MAKTPFTDLVPDLQAAILLLDKYEVKLKDVLKISEEIAKNTPLKNYDNINKATKAINESKEAVEGLDKIEKQRLTLLDKIDEANSDRIQDNVELQVQLQNQKKRNKELAKEKLGLLTTYDKESKRLRELKKQYKNAILQGKEFEESTQEIKSEIDELDSSLKELDSSVGDNYRNVGNYTESIKEAFNETGGLNDKLSMMVIGLNKVKTSLNLTSKEQKKETKQKVEAIKSNGKLSKSQQKWRIGLAKLTQGLKVAGRAIGKLALAGAAAGAIALGKAYAQSAQGGREFAKIQGQINGLSEAFTATASETGNVLFENLKDQYRYFRDILSGNKSITEANEDYRKSLEKTGKDLGEALDDLPGKFSKAAKAGKEIAELTFDLQLIEGEIAVVVAELRRLQEQEEKTADDATKSFREREEAAQKSRDLIIEIADEERSLAQQRFDILEKEKQLRAGTELYTVEFLKQYSEAQVGLIEADKNFQLAIQDNSKQQAELLQDRLEKNLDILIDGFDNIKTINERIIADEELAIDKRQELLDETVLLNDKSFKKQIETIQQFTDETINANDLINESDAELLNNKIRALGLSEIIEGRLLEVVRERRIQNQDLLEAQRDLNNEEEELRKRAAEIGVELLKDQYAQERKVRESEFKDLLEEINDNSTIETEKKAELIKEATARLQEDLSEINRTEIQAAIDREERLQTALIGQKISDFESEKEFAEYKEEELTKIQIEAIKKRIAAISDAEGEEIEVQREELKAQLAALEADLAKSGDKSKEFAEAFEDSLDLIDDRFKKSAKNRIDYIDKQIEDIEERQEIFQELAKKGVENAEDNLAFEQKRAAELAREREREIRRQKRAELALTALKTYASKVESGEKNPLGSTIRDIALLNAFLDTLPGFYEGSESVEDSMTPQLRTGKDDYIVRVDGKERILSPQQNAMIPDNMSNWELANAARAQRAGSTKFDNSEQVLKKFDELKSSIDNKPAYLGRDFDKTNKAIIETIAYKNKIERNHIKLRIQ